MKSSLSSMRILFPILFAGSLLVSPAPSYGILGLFEKKDDKRKIPNAGQGKKFSAVLSDDIGCAGAISIIAFRVGDFDADGLLDIYATTGFMSSHRNKPDG